jgi:hypothetical protein
MGATGGTTGRSIPRHYGWAAVESSDDP